MPSAADSPPIRERQEDPVNKTSPPKNLFRAVVLAMCLSAMPPLRAQVPLMFNYQGKVAVQNLAYTGTGYFKFELVDDPVSPSVNYWVSDGGVISAGAEPTAAVSLPVNKGLFTVKLGDTRLANMTALSPSLFSNAAVYLRVWFSTDGAVFERLTPDRQLVSVPYALHAASADTVGGSNTVTSAEVQDGTLVDADVSGSAGIAASKIDTGAATNLVSRVIAGSGISLNPGSGVGEVTISASGGGSGTVTSVATGAGLTGGPITGSGTLSVATGGITSGMIADGTITNADIAAGAAISPSKIAGGAGSSLDADKLDGKDSTAFAASGANSDITSLSGLVAPLSISQGGTGAVTAAGARLVIGAAASGVNADITRLSGLTSPISVAQGGTGAVTAAGARLVIGAAASGVNTDITRLSGLTSPIIVAQGGTGATTATAARGALGAAASGNNSDITALSGLTALKIPAAASPSLGADGEVALDTDNDAIKVRAGSNAAGGVPSATAVSLPLVHQKDITLVQPDQIHSVSTAVPFFTVDAYNYPNGITITAIRLATSSPSSLSIDVQEWATPTDGSPTTIANVALNSGTETTQTTFADATVSSGSYIFLGLDDSAVNWAKLTIWYYVN
jgi:hypothetical protein